MKRWLGPFKILERIGPVAYRLDLPPTSRAHSVFHVSALRRYNAAADGRIIPPPPPVQIADQPEFEVEAIVDQRQRRNQLQYLVKWKGYPDHENTWEPLDHLDNAHEALEVFRRSRDLVGENVTSTGLLKPKSSRRPQRSVVRRNLNLETRPRQQPTRTNASPA